MKVLKHGHVHAHPRAYDKVWIGFCRKNVAFNLYIFLYKDSNQKQYIYSSYRTSKYQALHNVLHRLKILLTMTSHNISCRSRLLAFTDSSVTIPQKSLAM